MQQEKKYIISDCEGLLSCYLVFKWRLMLKGFLPSIILYESCPRIDFPRLPWTICFRVLTRYPLVIYTGLLPVIRCCPKSQQIRSTNSIILLRICRLMLNLYSSLTGSPCDLSIPLYLAKAQLNPQDKLAWVCLCSWVLYILR